ncbi:MAG: 3-phosphoshikimate 1-carboxyvinyltransferase [Actinomycetota bacterium]|nr:3-phosphoshikimate 1-carboxyvinyltransferase [Actinomycetota bacterium]
MEIKGAEKITGTIEIPGDKSISHRSAILSAMTSQKVIIRNFLFSEDCLSTLEVLKKLQIKIIIENQSITVYGRGMDGLSEPDDILYVGNSGTTIRLISGLLAAAPFMSVLNGDSSINRRPMDRIIEPLRQMGAAIYGRNNNRFAPLVIMGGKKLMAKQFNIPVASAQVKSCLLIAALNCKGTTEISQPAVSRDHTERMLQYFGADIKFDGQHSEIDSGSQIRGKDIFVPGDISSAAYFIVACLILDDSHIALRDVGINQTRSYFLKILMDMGADIRIKNKRTLNNEPVADIEVFSSKLQAIPIDKENIPNIIDEIPILCVAASKARGKTAITGAGELRHKESDRINAVYSQFLKMGVDISQEPDGLTIKGDPDFRPAYARLKSFGDHRIAMSCAILSLLGKEEAVIDDTGCINTSFPGFFDKLNKHIR